MNSLNSSLSNSGSSPSLLILDIKSVNRCHVDLPDMPRPSSAICYKRQFYVYVKSFETLEAAQKAADRLIIRNNAVILTSTPKGYVLWVLEPEAKLPHKPLAQ